MIIHLPSGRAVSGTLGEGLFHSLEAVPPPPGYRAQIPTQPQEIPVKGLLRKGWQAAKFITKLQFLPVYLPYKAVKWATQQTRSQIPKIRSQIPKIRETARQGTEALKAFAAFTEKAEKAIRIGRGLRKQMPRPREEFGPGPYGSTIVRTTIPPPRPLTRQVEDIIESWERASAEKRPRRRGERRTSPVESPAPERAPRERPSGEFEPPTAKLPPPPSAGKKPPTGAPPPAARY